MYYLLVDPVSGTIPPLEVDYLFVSTPVETRNRMIGHRSYRALLVLLSEQPTVTTRLAAARNDVPSILALVAGLQQALRHVAEVTVTDIESTHHIERHFRLTVRRLAPDA